MPHKLLNPDFDEQLYKIEIIVSKNCNTIQTIPLKEGHEITYDSVIGVLEINKHNMIMAQSGHNKKVHKNKKP